MLSLGDENIFFINGDLNPDYNQHLLVMNHDNEVKYSFLPFHPCDYYHNRVNDALSKHDSTVFINYYANDTIYSLKYGQLKARFKFEDVSRKPLDFHSFESARDFNKALEEDRNLFYMIKDFQPIQQDIFSSLQLNPLFFGTFSIPRPYKSRLLMNLIKM
jgi:hypothetical protein